MSPREAHANAELRREAPRAEERTQGRATSSETRTHEQPRSAVHDIREGIAVTAEFNIDIPAQYPALIASAARNAQYAPAPAAPNFDARLAEAKAHATHIESLRAWSMLAARGHSGAQAVMAHPEVQAKLGTRIPPTTPAPVRAAPIAVTPRPPRVAVPAVLAVQQPSPMLDGVAGRVAMLTNLLTPPAPPGLLD